MLEGDTAAPLRAYIQWDTPFTHSSPEVPVAAAASVLAPSELDLFAPI